MRCLIGAILRTAAVASRAASVWLYHEATNRKRVSERCPASSPQPIQTVIAAGEIGSHLPEFSMKDLRGREISSADLRGKVVLIDFWATWCQPCKKEMPGYQKLADRYGPRGFAVIGLKFDTMADTEDPILFAKRIGVRYPLAVAVDELKQKFGGI
jgi:thiol-disulfide isomerase/thioredoxin